MLKGIDHLVIVVGDLDQAVRDYTQLGFTVVPGGQHPVGSHNALVSFADGSYLEIIAFYREAIEHRWWAPLEKGERLVDYCLQTDNLRGDTEKLRKAGVAINDPVPWSRKRPDGFELKWLLSLASGSHRGVAPFLIEDVTPRAERIPQQFHHKNGATGIGSLSIAVGGLSQVELWYQAVLGVTGMPFDDDTVGAKGLRFTVGPHDLEFVMPTDPSSPLVDWMKKYGPSPYSASLSRPGASEEILDLGRTHGAKLSFGQ